MAHHSQVHILGIRVDDVTYDEALARIEEFIADGRPHQVTTVNPEFIMTAQGDPSFAHILNRAHLNLPDGQGLIWAASLLGVSLRERVTGVDTVVRLAQLSAEKGYSIFLLGAGEGVATAAAQELQRRFPRLEIAGTYAGSPAPEEDDRITERIRCANPHLLLVAYGAPHQEKWISRNMGRVAVPVSMGVGGAFDFVSGAATRAPNWVQRLGLEWLYRLAHQPRRWRRMLALPRFGLLVLRDSTR
ncbi:MAG TPA: WecB/TagA/CpsF family glycosyltransferase [Anaerolineae bacterium]|nr:WecB/TagA/CpsF family glycosyltransferase [Anaerolineae bacterium]